MLPIIYLTDSGWDKLETHFVKFPVAFNGPIDSLLLILEGGIIASKLVLIVWIFF